jgi:hypothetical protein
MISHNSVNKACSVAGWHTSASSCVRTTTSWLQSATSSPACLVCGGKDGTGKVGPNHSDKVWELQCGNWQCNLASVVMTYVRDSA